jgi:hypothetical protein
MRHTNMTDWLTRHPDLLEAFAMAGALWDPSRAAAGLVIRRHHDEQAARHATGQALR